MPLDQIDVGALPDDGTGDTIRDSFIKTNTTIAAVEPLVDGIDLDGQYVMKPITEDIGSSTDFLGLFRDIEGVEELVGEISGGYTDQYVFFKALGGVRFADTETNIEYFALRRDLTGDALGAVFGNLDTNTGNFFATSDVGGLTICQKTDTDIQQQLGNPASLNFIESTFFSWTVTSDQVLPYGAQTLFSVGETDVDFVDNPFDVRILDSTGTIVYSDIQNLDVWLIEPQPEGDPKFKMSSAAGVVTLPMSQPFPMDSSETYTVEYRFKNAIRLKGDGVQPALVMHSKRLEYYPWDYTAQVPVHVADFDVFSGQDYKIDTTAGAVTGTVHPTVQSATFGDYNLTWDNADPFILSTDVGSLNFGTSEKGKIFQMFKEGATYRIYNADGSLHAVIV